MIKVLLLGVGGNVTQGILKAIRRAPIDTEVIGACISPLSSGLYMCDEAIISPYAADNDFLPWLVEICNSRNIDIIMTGVEENICAIAKQYDYFSAHTKAIFITSDYEKLQIGQDKYLTCKWLKENDCNYPPYCLLDEVDNVKKMAKEEGFPLIIKPRCGKGAMGVHIIEDEKELDKYIGISGYVLEKCIGTPESEYTVGCYCDKNGILQDIIIMRRRLKNGTTVYAKVVDNEAIRMETKKIVERLKPSGAFNIQLRLDSNGRPFSFEFNMRFSGTTAMRSAFGYCDVEAMLKEYVLNEKIDDCFNIKYGEAFRYDEEMYIFDDSVREMEDSGELSGIKDRRIVKGY